jgi:hypothetical protein
VAVIHFLELAGGNQFILSKRFGHGIEHLRFCYKSIIPFIG